MATHCASDVQKQAIFAISQLDKALAADTLVRLSNELSSTDMRKKALFWLGETSPEVALETYRALLLGEEDHALLKQAIFSLSQLGVPVLVDVLHNDPRTSLRREAVFWLAQADGERVARFWLSQK